jgi:hypothetical protein
MVQWVVVMVTKNQLVEITETAIDKLVKTFKAMPYFFYTENDLHTFLYHKIYASLPQEEWQCLTKDGKSSILLHKEYPTKERYSAKELKENVTKGARGHFDLCIWNPEKTSDRLFRVVQSTNFKDEQHTFIAIEFDLIEATRNVDQAVHHFKWDLLKLKSSKNEVEHCYSLVFVRDWANKDNFLEKIKSEVADEEKIVVLLAESDKNQITIGTLSQKPFLNYKPLL